MALKPLVELRALCVGLKALWPDTEHGVCDLDDRDVPVEDCPKCMKQITMMKTRIADLAIEVFGSGNDPCS